MKAFTHELTIESLAAQLAKIDYATKVWLLLEDNEPSWWSITTGVEHPYDATDSGLVWVEGDYVESLDFKDEVTTEENAARLLDGLMQTLIEE